YGQVRATQVFARKGPCLSRAATAPGYAPAPDLGSGCPLATVRVGSAAPGAGCGEQCARGRGPSLHRCDLGSGGAVKRGQVWTVSGGGEYAGKPRPAVIVQDDAFEATASVTICIFTTNPIEAPLFRIRIEPDERNGLRTPSSLMVDKITTVSRV